MNTLKMKLKLRIELTAAVLFMKWRQNQSVSFNTLFQSIICCDELATEASTLSVIIIL